MTSKGPWLLALALDLLAEEVDENKAVQALVSAAQGSRDALRGAYARALALVGELPDDVTARQTLDLLMKAMRAAMSPLVPRRD